EAEGVAGPEVDAFFLALGNEMTQEPMGRKVREIYRITFERPPPVPGEIQPSSRKRVYRGVVTEANAQRCREFLAANMQYFDRAQKLHGIPPEILVSLLFVETRLGTAIGGGNNALHTLASMAISKKPEQIPAWLEQLPEGHAERLDWMEDLMQKRSEWAYKEVKALVSYVRKYRLDMTAIPGSYYGAIGFCQFMPTNIEPYGVDGDGDGVIDLFSMSDAIASVANYLAKHGWKPGLNRDAQHRVLRTYNHVDIYPNTILALSDLVIKPAGKSARKPQVKSGKKKRLSK
ncbi:MAG: lytic murein transglycosylase, partial [Deltaproteobacteria bacterium]|nr:lytic murein transglycosylase [Deltaproteobacteria bacterium]